MASAATAWIDSLQLVDKDDEVEEDPLPPPPPPPTHYFVDRAALFTAGPTGLCRGADPMPPGHTSFSWPVSVFPPPHEYKLRRVLELAHEAECTSTFRRELALEVAASVSQPPYYVDAATFAAGCSSLGAVSALLTLPAVQAAVDAIRSAPAAAAAASKAAAPSPPAAPVVTVLGCGVGVLPLLLHLLTGARVIAYDVLPIMTITAAAIAAEVGVDAARVEFRTGDAAVLPAADDTLAATALLVLASRTWGVHLRRVVYGQLAARLPHGAVIVDTAPAELPGASRGGPVAVIPLVEAHYDDARGVGRGARVDSTAAAPLNLAHDLALAGDEAADVPNASPTTTTAAAAAASTALVLAAAARPTRIARRFEHRSVTPVARVNLDKDLQGVSLDGVALADPVFCIYRVDVRVVEESS